MSDYIWQFVYAFAGIMTFHIFHKVLVLIYEAWKFNSEIGYRHGKRKEEEFVGVVRCKDCKWRNKAGCALRIVDDSDKPSDDDYCSYGERKE